MRADGDCGTASLDDAVPAALSYGTKLSAPSVYAVTVVGPEPARAFEQCAAALDNVAVIPAGADGRPLTDLTDPAAQEAFVINCVGATAPENLVPELVGPTEQQATNPPGADTNIRIVGRDGTYSVGLRDYDRQRLNLILVDGKVIWAAHG